jgi:hypothetical protein
MLIIDSINYRLIHQTNSREEVLVMQSILESYGIKCRVQQESIGKLYAIASDGLGETRLFVPEDDAERAMEILEDMKEADSKS